MSCGPGVARIQDQPRRKAAIKAAIGKMPAHLPRRNSHSHTSTRTQHARPGMRKARRPGPAHPFVYYNSRARLAGKAGGGNGHAGAPCAASPVDVAFGRAPKAIHKRSESGMANNGSCTIMHCDAHSRRSLYGAGWGWAFAENPRASAWPELTSPIRHPGTRHTRIGRGPRYRPVNSNPHRRCTGIRMRFGPGNPWLKAQTPTRPRTRTAIRQHRAAIRTGHSYGGPATAHSTKAASRLLSGS